MFVVDLLHEFELGVWKAIFTHLLRVLYAEGHDRIQIFNKRWALYCRLMLPSCSDYTRFRKVTTFGRGTIRHFGNNVSGMKKLAARDFEDILQVLWFCPPACMSNHMHSVLFQYLKASCLPLTTRWFWTSYLSSLYGMHLPNFAFTRIQLLIFLKPPQSPFLPLYDDSLGQLVNTTLPKSSQKKQQLEDDVKQHLQPRAAVLTWTARPMSVPSTRN